jgi:hypothetical protein
MNKFLNNKSKNFFINDINVSDNIHRDRKLFFNTTNILFMCFFQNMKTILFIKQTHNIFLKYQFLIKLTDQN